MKLDAADLCVAIEVLVEGEDGHIVFLCQCADQEIDVRTLDAFLPASVEEARRLLVRGGFGWDVLECAELQPEPTELRVGRNSAEDLLPNATRHARARFVDQRGKLADNALFRYGASSGGPASKSDRPDRGVDENFQRLRPFLWS